MKTMARIRVATGTLAIAAAVSLAACNGSGSDSSQPTPQVSIVDAQRLLEQATFGPTTADVAHVQSLGISAWIDEQQGLSTSGYTGYAYVAHTAPDNCKYDSTAPTSTASLCNRDNYTPFQLQRTFFIDALSGQDQLRQRVAWALSQIFVVSSSEVYEAYGMAAYQNLLLKDAFVNFRQLMEDVTLSPAMGQYLNMVNNDKPNATKGTSPNENYARELLQLFTIGLYKLNQDGTQQLDSSGQPIPTYDQTTVEGFAKLFTGWTYPAMSGATSKWTNTLNYQGTMVSFPDHHDIETKQLLDGVTSAAGQTPEQDLKFALDQIFNHANVGPFIATRLIQQLVTSNPSAAYVGRVAAVFANDGTGTRGNMAAVVKAILVDDEARGAAPASSVGHFREPVLFITTLMRALGGTSDGVYLRGQTAAMGQSVFSSPSVFNFYPPSYTIPGTQTLAPELFIDAADTALARANFVNQMVYGGGVAADSTVTGSTGTQLDLTALSQATSDATLVDTLAAELTHDSLSTLARSTITTALGTVTGSTASATALAKARAATYLVASSAQFQVEH